MNESGVVVGGGGGVVVAVSFTGARVNVFTYVVLTLL
jgi:hypothetical protein